MAPLPVALRSPGVFAAEHSYVANAIVTSEWFKQRSDPPVACSVPRDQKRRLVNFT
jgi:hypothetical protein